jgi:hypothetical protein
MNIMNYEEHKQVWTPNTFIWTKRPYQAGMTWGNTSFVLVLYSFVPCAYTKYIYYVPASSHQLKISLGPYF